MHQFHSPDISASNLRRKLDMTDSMNRFTNRVENYRKYRPGYPPEVLSVLQQVTGFNTQWVVADLGAGTGISSQLFLEHGNEVYAVEPNRSMRQAAKELFGDQARLHIVEGTAEATTLPDAAIDLVVAAQAFHWFNIPATRLEVRRIRTPQGWVALIWNHRQTQGSKFLVEYEQLLCTYGRDYAAIRDSHRDQQRLEEFFGDGQPGSKRSYQTFEVAHEKWLTYEDLRGLLMSASYVPLEAQPGHANMLLDLRSIFARHAKDGLVLMKYQTELIVGQ